LPLEAPIFLKFMQAQFNVDLKHSPLVNKREAIRAYEKILHQYKLKDGETRLYEPRGRKDKPTKSEEFFR
jgi:hypothetical protein